LAAAPSAPLRRRQPADCSALRKTLLLLQPAVLGLAALLLLHRLLLR
jgi:hypothetical protein